MSAELRSNLKIPTDRLDAINKILLADNMQVIDDFLAVVDKYGTPEEINRKAMEARKLENLRSKVADSNPEFLKTLDWLTEQREQGVFMRTIAKGFSGIKPQLCPSKMLSQSRLRSALINTSPGSQTSQRKRSMRGA
jgi:hypothetical protein